MTRRPRIHATCVAFVLAAVTSARAALSQSQGEARSLARVSTVPAAEGRRVEEALTVDVDGDDVADLVVVTSGDGGRRLALHLRRRDGAPFTGTPDATLDLTPDVVCFGAADVHADVGREIVLFNASGAFAWRWRATVESERIVRLFSCDLLWQWPDRKTAFVWQAGIRDLDGDGLEDFVVPAPWSTVIVFQRKGDAGARTFATAATLRPGTERELMRQIEFEDRPDVRRAEEAPGMHVRVTGRGVQLDGKGGGTGPSSYLWVRASVPAPQLVDFDGDGDLDVAFLTSQKMLVFRQEPRGAFTQEPVTLVNPVKVDRARELDVSYSARSLDLDGDGRFDALFTAGDKRSSDVRTQMLVYLQKAVKAGEAPLFGAAGVPVQLIVLDGFARPLALDDVDLDGRKDLVCGAVRPDLIDGLRAAASERIDAELYVYRNTGLGFSKRPDLVRKVSIHAGGLDLTARFLGDVTGDGVADLFERAGEDVLRVRMVRRTKEGFTVLDTPVYELQLAEDARLLLPGRIGPGNWDLFVLEKEAVRCVSFR